MTPSALTKKGMNTHQDVICLNIVVISQQGN